MLKLTQENKKKGIKSSSILEYLRVNKSFIQFIGKKPQHITKSDIAKFKGYIARKYPEKLNTAISALMYFYSGLKRSTMPP